MEVIEKIILHKRPDKFKIYPLGDIHSGSVHCAEHDIQRKVAEIASDKSAYWVGMGDMADCIINNDPRFDIGGLSSWVRKDNIVESQRKWLNDLLKPIAPKCLAFLSGNHEEQIHSRYQIDFTRNLCDDLKVPYGGYSCFLVIKFQRGNGTEEYKLPTRQYILHLWHGAGAAQTEGARVMRLMRLVNEIQADIYLMGHLHITALYTPDRLIYQNGKVRSVKLTAAITGSWLKTYTQPKGNEQINPSYAEIKGYKPSRIGCPVIYLQPNLDTFSIEG